MRRWRNGEGVSSSFDKLRTNGVTWEAGCKNEQEIASGVASQRRKGRVAGGGGREKEERFDRGTRRMPLYFGSVYYSGTIALDGCAIEDKPRTAIQGSPRKDKLWEGSGGGEGISADVSCPTTRKPVFMSLLCWHVRNKISGDSVSSALWAKIGTGLQLGTTLATILNAGRLRIPKGFTDIG